MKLTNLSVLAVLGLGLTGCASITQGTSQTILFNLEPKETTCVATRDGDGQLGTLTTSNNSLSVSKSKDDIVVTCRAPGFKQTSVRLVSSTQAAGVVGGIFLDLGIVDMMTGAMWKYPESTNVSLERDEAASNFRLPSK
jgi:hypothetical protein